MLDSWFREVPAYRLAAFRVVLATTTLSNLLPVLTDWLRQAAASPATTASIWWVPHLSPPVVLVVLAIGWAAGVTLLVGWRPSASAGYLVVLGVYGYAVGNHSHNGFLHLLLLALMACSTDRLTLRRLVQGTDDDATCPGWPEQLLRLQLVILYFHTAIDKVFSPEWGLGGLRLTHLTATSPLPMVAALQRWVMGLIAAFPGLFSLAVIAGEALLAVGLLLRPLWPVAIVANVGFALSLEFLLAPAMFPWDLMTLMILFVPAADRRYRVRLSKGGWGPLAKRLLAALDWTRRLEIGDAEDDRWSSLETPSGRRLTGWRAAARLPLALPAPTLCVLILIRFGAAALLAAPADAP